MEVNMDKKAFTLAEVLITLGIIGVVAALTMPSLIQHYKNKVLETRIKAFYSVFKQTYGMKIAEDSELDASMITANNDPDVAMQFFDVNYRPYMKVVASQKTNKGFSARFPNGSGMHIRRTSTCGNKFGTISCTYVYFCVDYKNCKTLNENSDTTPTVDGRNTFLFWTDGGYEGINVKETREQIKSQCKAYGYYCTKLILTDGWEIRNDYPR
jgi:prepilin-type N-terminal cleavage/methylation domain-containing protein